MDMTGWLHTVEPRAFWCELILQSACSVVPLGRVGQNVDANFPGSQFQTQAASMTLQYLRFSHRALRQVGLVGEQAPTFWRNASSLSSSIILALVKSLLNVCNHPRDPTAATYLPLQEPQTSRVYSLFTRADEDCVLCHQEQLTVQ